MNRRLSEIEEGINYLLHIGNVYTSLGRTLFDAIPLITSGRPGSGPDPKHVFEKMVIPNLKYSGNPQDNSRGSFLPQNTFNLLIGSLMWQFLNTRR